MITFFQGEISVPPHGTSETQESACVAPTRATSAWSPATSTRTARASASGSATRRASKRSSTKRTTGRIRVTSGIGAKPPNQAPDPASCTHGGWNGFLTLEPGESLVYQCAFQNPTDQTITLGELGADQMCNVFGMYYPSDGNVWGCVCLGEGCF